MEGCIGQIHYQGLFRETFLECSDEKTMFSQEKEKINLIGHTQYISSKQMVTCTHSQCYELCPIGGP